MELPKDTHEYYAYRRGAMKQIGATAAQEVVEAEATQPTEVGRIEYIASQTCAAINSESSKFLYIFRVGRLEESVRMGEHIAHGIQDRCNTHDTFDMVDIAHTVSPLVHTITAAQQRLENQQIAASRETADAIIESALSKLVMSLPSTLLHPNVLNSAAAAQDDALKEKYLFLTNTVRERYGMEMLLGALESKIIPLRGGDTERLRLHNNELARLLTNQPDSDTRNVQKLLRLGRQPMTGYQMSIREGTIFSIHSPDATVLFHANKQGELLLGDDNGDYAAVQELFANRRRGDIYQMLRATILATQFDVRMPQNAVPRIQRMLSTPPPSSLTGRRPKWPFNDGVPQQFAHLLLPRLRFLLLPKGQMSRYLEEK